MRVRSSVARLLWLGDLSHCAWRDGFLSADVEVVIDAQGRIVSVNAPMSDLLPPKERNCLVKAFKKVRLASPGEQVEKNVFVSVGKWKPRRR